MAPIVRMLPRLLLLYLKHLGFIASDGSPQDDRFMSDRWQPWQKSDKGRHRLDPCLLE
jgi:hypothetical protein